MRVLMNDQNKQFNQVKLLLVFFLLLKRILLEID